MISSRSRAPGSNISRARIRRSQSVEQEVQAEEGPEEHQAEAPGHGAHGTAVAALLVLLLQQLHQIARQNQRQKVAEEVENHWGEANMNYYE